MQAVEQVLAEAPALHVGDQIAIGGGDQPHIDFHRFAGADRLDLAFLDGAQELDLRGRRQLADLIEEQRAAGGLRELSDMAVGGAGEGAFLVTEQNGFHEIVGDGAAIDGDERLGAPLAAAVYRARDHFLADAGLAFDQHRNGRTRGFFRGPQHRLHAGTAGDDVLEGQRAGTAALDAGKLALQRVGGERIAQRHLQPLRSNRLDDEIGGAGAHRRDHVIDAAMSGLHDDRDGEPGLAHARQHAEPVEVGHHQVENDSVDADGFRAGQDPCGIVAAIGDDRLVAEPAHHIVEETALHGIVIDDEDTLGHDSPQPATVYRIGALSPTWLNGM